MSRETGSKAHEYWWRREKVHAENRPAAGTYWWKEEAGPEEGDVCAIRPRPGHRCPECGEGTLAYNGLFLLTCPECHYVAEGGANF
jgi:hypothetical protein